jgi:hypothetical protein
MNMNIRLFIVAAVSFGCGLSFQYSDVIEFDDNYTLSLEQVRRSVIERALARPRKNLFQATVANNLILAGELYDLPLTDIMDLPLSDFVAAKYMSKGRQNAVTVAYALGSISLIGGILITGLNKEKT